MSQPQQQIIYQQVVRAPGNGNAVAALVLGIVAIVLGVWVLIPIVGLFFAFISFLPAVLAIVFGHIGVARAGSVGGIGRPQAIGGLATGYATIVLIALTTVFWVVTIGTQANSNYP